MKANELMIGDWVKTTSDWPERYQNKITRVRGLCDENGQIDCDLTEPNGSYVWSDDEDSFEPIPLTAEILEKNGFHHHLIAEKGFTREEWTLSDDYYDIVIRQWSDSIWLFIYECTEMNIPHEQRTFSYVYNLQHALRECGIDKEIVL